MASRRINLDWPLVLTALALTTYGILMVYSAGRTDVPKVAVARAYQWQIVWLFVAMTAAFVMTRASVRFLEWMTVPAYALSIFLLIVVLIPGFGSGGGTAKTMNGWLTVAGHRIGQPAELAKLGVVLMLARLLSQRKQAPKSTLDLWQPVVALLIPLALIAKQPDFGTSIVFVGIFFGMLFWAGVPWRLLLLLASPAISLILTFDTRVWGTWYLLFIALLIWYKPYISEGVLLAVVNAMMGVVGQVVWEQFGTMRQNRLLVFLDNTLDPRGVGYHVMQSQVAIGSGGLFGRGFTMGPQKRLAFVPEQHTDFIFAVVGEELGFIGVAIALALFLILFLRVIRIAERSNDGFSSLVAFGLLSSWFAHVFENVGMTQSLMPVTGIPLPFFSYGGSFLLASWLSVGILARISSEGRGGLTGPFRV